MVGLRICISRYCECIRPRVGSHRLAFTTYATGLGPSCSHHPQISSPAPSPASTKTGGHFIGMAMGMSMTSDPQHHSMGGSMNGMSYSHGLFDCVHHTLHRPNSIQMKSRWSRPEAKTRTDDVHSWPTGRAGIFVRQDPLSGHLHARRSGPENQFAGISCPGLVQEPPGQMSPAAETATATTQQCRRWRKQKRRKADTQTSSGG